MNKSIKSLAVGIALLSGSLTAQEQKAEVMIMGSFHFANPQLDLVKSAQIDVTTAENQLYLTALSEQIADEFAPTHILLECPKHEQDKYQENFEQFTKGQFNLPVNESYQLGFRIAKNSNGKVICFDERDVEFKSEAVMQVMNENDRHQFFSAIEHHARTEEEKHKTLSLKQILASHNNSEADKANKGLYMLLNHVGSGQGYEGADSAASWWHRNFRMYANVQKAAQPDTRVFVLAGGGHTAILSDFLAFDQKRAAKDIRPFLQ